MKNLNANLFLILLVFFVAAGCKNGFFSSSSKTRNEDKNRAPIALTAKMVENLPAPSDAETAYEKADEKRPPWVKKFIRLKSAASVYDVTNFYCEEMVKNGWRSDEDNERDRKDSRSIFSTLKFLSETEEADVRIITDSDDGSKIEIEISENSEYSAKRRDEERRKDREERDEERRRLFPMPACADGSNMITSGGGTTLSAVCNEQLSSVAKFYSEEPPKAGWKLNSKTGNAESGETVTMIYNKEDRRAIITLVRDGANSTSVNVRIVK